MQKFFIFAGKSLLNNLPTSMLAATEVTGVCDMFYIFIYIYIYIYKANGVCFDKHPQ